jgi:phage tail protein X
VRVNAHDLSDDTVDTVCAHVYASLGEAVLMSVHYLAFLSMVWPEAHAP